MQIELRRIKIELSPIRSDEGQTLETSAFQSLYGGQFTLSTPLINLIFPRDNALGESRISADVVWNRGPSWWLFL